MQNRIIRFDIAEEGSSPKKDEKKIAYSRNFVSEVRKIAEKYGLPFFIVTDGASAYSNNGCDAVKHARDSHKEWETSHGEDPNEDWGED